MSGTCMSSCIVNTGSGTVTPVLVFCEVVGSTCLVSTGISFSLCHTDLKLGCAVGDD